MRVTVFKLFSRPGPKLSSIFAWNSSSPTWIAWTCAAPPRRTTTFFTVGEDEVRAWEIARNTTAQKGAGRIHSDLERGFIRAETVTYADFIDCGTMAEARNRGLFRQEGRDYVVQDGDIVNFLFSV